jgi:hypothetical protein
MGASDRCHECVNPNPQTPTPNVRWGRVIDAMNVFVCGLPGGLDYVLLTLVKFGVIDKMVPNPKP